MDLFDSVESLEALALRLGMPGFLTERAFKASQGKDELYTHNLRNEVFLFVMQCALVNKADLMLLSITPEDLLLFGQMGMKETVDVPFLEKLAAQFRVPLFLLVWSFVVAMGQTSQPKPVADAMARQMVNYLTPPPVLASFGAGMPEDLRAPLSRAFPSGFRVSPEASLELAVHRDAYAWLRGSRQGLWLNLKRIWKSPVLAAVRIPGRHHMALIVQPSGRAFLVALYKGASKLEVLMTLRLFGEAAQDEAANDEATYAAPNAAPGSRVSKQDLCLRAFRAAPGDSRVIVTWADANPAPKHVSDTMHRQRQAAADAVDREKRAAAGQETKDPSPAFDDEDPLSPQEPPFMRTFYDMEYMVLDIPPGPAPLKRMPRVITVSEEPPLEALFESIFLDCVKPSWRVHENVMYGATYAHVTPAVDSDLRTVVPVTKIGYGTNPELFRASNKWYTAVFGTPQAFVLAERSGKLFRVCYHPSLRNYTAPVPYMMETPIRGTCTTVVPLEPSDAL
jgi:hypothetical protein